MELLYLPQKLTEVICGDCLIAHANVDSSSSSSDNDTVILTIKSGTGNNPNDANGKAILKPKQAGNYKIFEFDSTLNNRTADLPIGTLVFVNFPGEKHDVSISPNKGVVERAKGKYHLPKNTVTLLKVIGEGSVRVSIT